MVLVLGTDLSSAHEGQDAVNITLGDGQQALLKEVLAVAARPVVVVVMTAVRMKHTQERSRFRERALTGCMLFTAVQQ